MPTAPRSPLLIRLASAAHRGLYRASAGRLGGSVGGAPVLLLATRGRRSGKVRTTPLLYVRDGEDFVVVASNGGRDQHPAWWPNLQAHPRPTVQVKGERLAVEAGEVTGPERERLWALLVAAYPAYDTYRQRTARELPVVRLRPHATGRRDH
jgi:deazaflavin-dependent oxidoreductase (nitroreductase family)